MEQTILRTRSYNKFKLNQKNRRINYNKVERLAAAIDKNNLLNLFPIVVNKKHEILDGQHRFEAAKSIKAELFYVISDDNYDFINVAESNNFQSHWKLDDYINYYAVCGFEPYKKLLDLSKKYNIAGSFICNIHQIASVAKQIKEGSFEFKEYPKTVEILKLARQIGLEFDFKYWNHRAFLRAITFVLKLSGFSKMRLFQKLQTHKDLLVRAYTANDYIKLLETIYNYNSSEELRFL